MGDIINLNRCRKQKQQRERERRANEKRVRSAFPERAQQECFRAGAGKTRRLDGVRREDRGAERD